MRRLIPLLLAFLMLGAVFAIYPFQPPTPQQQTQTKEQTVYTTKTGKKGSEQETVKAYPFIGFGLERFYPAALGCRDGLPGLNVSGLRGRV